MGKLVNISSWQKERNVWNFYQGQPPPSRTHRQKICNNTIYQERVQCEHMLLTKQDIHEYVNHTTGVYIGFQFSKDFDSNLGKS